MKLFLLAALSIPAWLFAQETGSVSGSVVDSSTGAGVAGVSVYFGQDQGSVYEATTDASGAFEFSWVEPVRMAATSPDPDMSLNTPGNSDLR
jgi:hypothetical protein